MKILICGDSFAADWTVKYTGEGWPNLLATKYNVTNLAQAGCSEYKIYQQLCLIKLEIFDVIIISHTSPFRIPVKKHPMHANDPLHKNCDLIYSDLKEHSGLNPNVLPIIKFYEDFFNDEYALFVHNLICKEIDLMLGTLNSKIIHINNFSAISVYTFKNTINFLELLSQHTGKINHFDVYGNKVIFEKLISILEKEN